MTIHMMAQHEGELVTVEFVAVKFVASSETVELVSVDFVSVKIAAAEVATDEFVQIEFEIVKFLRFEVVPAFVTVKSMAVGLETVEGLQPSSLQLSSLSQALL